MPPQARPSGRKPKPKPKQEDKQQKRKRGEESLQALQAKVDALDPKAEHKDFADLPLSDQTASGLRASHFTTLTDIQSRAIPLALQRRDILGAAKTGSGKTLAFLIPVLESLHRERWTEFDGLGALILSPTRELAVQTFEVLRKIGRYHAFSAGLIIGGKDQKAEAERMTKMNILVCTPGRMLHHLDQTAGFEANNLQMLVLDEADRIMDMGFQSAVDALIEHLPTDRQTLMFSATQSRKVSDLARLSLKEPEYVSVHEEASQATPSSLQQHYIVTPLEEKMDTIFGFIKANLKSKIIIFLSSGKQVRFAYESIRKLQPGIPLLHLHGRQKQTARMGITKSFTSSQNSCLFATDVVARGIDFPAVDWVIQADCPEDADTYIHRVGRTARYHSNGRAVLFLEPSEEDGMIKKLEQKKIPIKKINVKDGKKRSIQNHLQNLCFQNPDLRYLGQKAFISYTRAIRLRQDKDVFKFDKLDLDAFAESLGLPGTPQTKFKDNGEERKRIKNAERQGMSSDSESDFDEEGNKKPKKEKKDKVRTKYDKMFERQNQDVLSSHYSKVVGEGSDEDSDDDILTAKRTLKGDDLDDASGSVSTLRTLDLGGKDPYVIDSKRREKALKSKKKMAKFKGNSQKIVYDSDGEEHAPYELGDEEDFAREAPAEEQRQKFLESENERVKIADMDDKALAREKKREKRAKRKEREAAEMGGYADPDGDDAPRLAGDDDGYDPLEFMRSLPIAGEDEESDDEPPRKKAKKWFQDDSEDEEPKKKKTKKSKKGKVFEVQDEPQELEDLEALAAGLLDG